MAGSGSAKSTDDRGGWGADVTVLLVGLVVIVAAINNVPVNLPGLVNVNLPAPGALVVQIVFGLVGASLVIKSLARFLYAEYWLSQFLATRRRRHLGRLIIAMNILRFDRGGIKELLQAYKTQKSAPNWQRIMKRADVNENRLKRLRHALDQAEANGELAHDFRVAHLLNEFLYGKEGSLYNPLFALRDEPPASDIVVDQLLQQARLMDLRKSEIVRAQRALAKRLGPPPNQKYEQR